MKQESDKRPLNKYEIENIEGNRCEVVLFDLDSIVEETIEQETNNNEVDESIGNKKTVEDKMYTYYSYRIKLPYYEGLATYLDENYKDILDSTVNKEKEDMSNKVRGLRNKLLEETDKEMTFDRLGIKLEDFEIPEKLTITNIYDFVTSLAHALKSFGKLFSNVNNSAMAKYRQELRDITKQEGFPFNVVFPDKPEKK